MKRWGVLGLLVVVGLVAVIIAVRATAPRRAPKVVRVATGPAGGRFLPLGQTLAKVLSARVPGGHTFVAIESPGGEGNVTLLEQHEAELALVSADALGGTQARAIAPLYPEVLQLVVREDATLDGPAALRGRRVSVGPAKSGSDAVGRRVLAHFGLGNDNVSLRNMPHDEAADALERGELDAMIVLGGIRTPVVERVLARSGMRLLSLGDPEHQGSSLEGILIDAPFLTATVIPQGAYGAVPQMPVGTVGVQALFAARGDLPEDFIYETSRALFENKVDLVRQDLVLARLSEHFDPADLPIPLHAGAANYFRRQDPPVIFAWVGTISLLLSVAVIVGSGMVSLRAARHATRKNRIEAYYAEVHNLLAAARMRTRAEQRRALQGVHHLAVEDVIAERLDANASFIAFQDYVRAELAEIDADVPIPRRAAS